MRLFAGIALDGTTRAMCVDVQERLRLAAFEAKYEAAEKLHVTLAFLGSIDDERVSQVEQVLDDTAASISPFDLTWDRVGAFPNERRPRIAFVGSREQGGAFRSLAYGLRDRYRALGFAFNDDAVAHVTIARIKGGSPRALPMLDLIPHVMRASEIALFESLPAENSTRYEIRKRTPLAH